MLIRSRLVARDFKGNDKDRDDLFAGTSPLAAAKTVISDLASRGYRSRKGHVKKTNGRCESFLAWRNASACIH